MDQYVLWWHVYSRALWISYIRVEVDYIYMDSIGITNRVWAPYNRSSEVESTAA